MKTIIIICLLTLFLVGCDEPTGNSVNKWIAESGDVFLLTHNGTKPENYIAAFPAPKGTWNIAEANCNQALTYYSTFQDGFTYKCVRAKGFM